MNEPPWYHSIWLTPLMVILLAYRWCAARLTQVYYYVKIRYILWKNPELKDLQKLAGAEQ